MRFLIIAARSFGAVLCDLAIVFGGAGLLWTNGQSTAVDGPLLPQLGVILGTALVLLVRRSAIGQTEMFAVNTTTVMVNRVLVIAQPLCLIVGITLWKLLDEYYIGWLTTYGAVVLVLGTTFQLLADVTSGRNLAASKSAYFDRGERLVARRLYQLESWRIGAAVLGVAIFGLSTPIHEWDAQIVNPLIAILALAMGLGIATNASASWAKTRMRNRTSS